MLSYLYEIVMLGTDVSDLIRKCMRDTEAKHICQEL